MKPENLKTKIFLDSGNPDDTRQIIDLLGFIDGQTTNPTLISKHPDARKKFESGEKFTEEEILDFYQKIATEISEIIPEGSVSIEVYADASTTSEEMIKQAKAMNTWIPNAHIKLPITSEGLKAAEQLTKEGIRLNMTLCFTQEQAAAVYAATKGAKKGDVFVSPFLGRIDDLGENGIDLIKNIMKMNEQGDGHVEVLAASIRSLDHLLYSLKLGANIITAPQKILKAWSDLSLKIPSGAYQNDSKDLMTIPYQEIDLNKNWQKFNISHKLTDQGLERFANDWNALIQE